MTREKCPICGFDQMPYPPVPENICPCCGTEFGFDDYYHRPEELRRAWIQAKFPWFDDIIRPPVNWSPVLQLIKADYGAELIDLRHAVTEGAYKNLGDIDKVVRSAAGHGAHTLEWSLA